MQDPVADLLAFIDRAPTPYHAVAESSARLEAAGFSRLDESELWSLLPGDRHYVLRAGGSLVAFEIGRTPAVEAGFRVVGAHTDSPNLRVKPAADVTAHGYRQLAVEPYGGVLLHTWLDRDLSLAGRVTLRDGTSTTTRLVDFRRPLLRVPNLAIHLYRELKEQGLKLNEQQHLVPVLGLSETPELVDLLCDEIAKQDGPRPAQEDVLAWDLMAYDLQPSTRSGAANEFIHAPRLDNLASSHAGLSALFAAASAGAGDVTRVVVLYDHEEVGSRSSQGAGGTLLSDALERIAASTDPKGSQSLARAVASSWLISADMAHAVHPNYADRHEPGHRPVIGGGPVIKTNVNQSYATDADTAGRFAALCARVGVPHQDFVTRSDLGCGSTIGPISAARVGLRTVDVGNPMLSMHSCREMAGAADVEPMIRVLQAFFAGD
ncbi:MAG: M18 family aminopeptidase [Deltaproteobacteria bacterium]|jgi:aspartyl aminopeptidase|nr:M18 family aminopeptidase [Deltaproteobacteria bacterium]MBW2496021.1 M18 family aminopeptidase [Deltaproteobacteria bacterium]